MLPGLCQRIGLHRACHLYAGTTDSIAATLACGIKHSGEAVTSLGSSLVLKVLANQPLFLPEHGVYSHRVADRWLVGGASNSGGAVLKHYFSSEKIQQLCLAINPNIASPLDYYPLLTPGERFPVNDPEWQPLMEPRPHADAQFLHALLQGIAKIEARGYALLESLLGFKVQKIYTSGGGAQNPTWRRIRERMLHRPVLVAEQQKPAYGSALLARSGYFHLPVF